MQFRVLNKKQVLLLMLLGQFFVSPAQNASSNGPAYFPGMPGFRLVNADKNKIKADLDDNRAGKIAYPDDVILTNYDYVFSGKSGKVAPTRIQVSEYYAGLMKKAPGVKSTQNKGKAGEEYFAGGYTHNGREIWINVAKFTMSKKDSTVAGYTLRYIESPQAGYINAATMHERIGKEGRVALDIHFETGKADVKEESLSQVYELVTMLRNDPSLKVSIEGHTDKMGSAALNMELSEARAKTVRDIVIRKGIDPNRLSTLGWGWNKPVDDNKTEIGRAKNRRVEIVKK